MKCYLCRITSLLWKNSVTRCDPYFGLAFKSVILLQLEMIHCVQSQVLTFLWRGILTPRNRQFLNTYVRIHIVTCSSICFSTVPVLSSLYHCCRSGSAPVSFLSTLQGLFWNLLKIILNVNFSLNMINSTPFVRNSLFCFHNLRNRKCVPNLSHRSSVFYFCTSFARCKRDFRHSFLACNRKQVRLRF